MDDNIMPEPQRQVNFREGLAELINSYSLENESDTPDFILAQYMQDCLRAFDRAVRWREQHYGRPLDRDVPKMVTPLE